jgi:hypothetical protein
VVSYDVGSEGVLFTLIPCHYEFILVFGAEDEEWRYSPSHTLRQAPQAARSRQRPAIGEVKSFG